MKIIKVVEGKGADGRRAHLGGRAPPTPQCKEIIKECRKTIFKYLFIWLWPIF